MIIAATGDVHSPRHYESFVKAVDDLVAKGIRPDLFMITGDMVFRGNVEEYDKINNALFGKITCPIIACFGNNEYIELREGLKQKFSNIRFLDDQVINFPLKISGAMRERNIGIIGTTGSLETPTPWQASNIPNISNIYHNRYEFVGRQLSYMKGDYRILLMHYAPTYKTLEGENPRYYGSMGWNVYENAITKYKPDLVIHGHAHRGKKQAWIEKTPVFNVCLPLNKDIVIIETNKLKPGLERFVGD